MRFTQQITLCSTLVLLAACVSSPATPYENTVSDEVSAPCIDNRDTLLAMSFEDFDQDLDGGWRVIADRDACQIAAADLLADYRIRYESDENFHGLSTLIWHEGQVRAGAGQTDQALSLFRRSYKEITHDTDLAWNYYVDATIAFLEQDREALDAAHAGLKAVPEPDFWAATAEKFEAEYGQKIVWPSNLNVVETLQACFGRPYAEAYGDCDEASDE